MYCKMCGNPLGDTDLVCKVCGMVNTKTKEPQDDSLEEVTDGAQMQVGEPKSNVSKPEDTEFEWNVYEFPKPRRTEDISFHWPPTEALRDDTDEEDPFSHVIEWQLSAKTPTEEVAKGSGKEQTAHTGSDSGTPAEVAVTRFEDLPGFHAEENVNLWERAKADQAKKSNADNTVIFPSPEKNNSVPEEMDKFFTFSKKNEDFQKLLDLEYEKIQKKNEDRPSVPDRPSYIPEVMAQSTPSRHGATAQTESPISEESAELKLPIEEVKVQPNSVVSEEKKTGDGTIPFDPEAILAAQKKDLEEKAQAEAKVRAEAVRAEAEAKAREEAVRAEAEAKARAEAVRAEAEAKARAEAVRAEAEARLREEYLKEETRKIRETNLRREEAEEFRRQQERIREQNILIDADTLQRLHAHANHLDEMARARASFFSEEVPKAIPKTEEARAEQDPPVSVQEKEAGPVADHSTEVRTTFGGNTEVLVTVAVKSGGASGTVSPTIELARSTETPVEAEEKPVEASCIEDALDRLQSEPVLTEAAEPRPPILGEEDTLPEDLVALWQDKPFQQRSREKEPLTVGKVILMILAVILVLELSAIGIMFFAPNSEAAQMIYRLHDSVISPVVLFFEDISSNDDKPSGTDEGSEAIDPKDQDTPVKQEEESPPPPPLPKPPDPLPMADKAALLKTQQHLNKNILQVQAADDLVFQKGKDYGIKDLNRSSAIENNIWRTSSTGETVYYDQAVVGAIIAFDSQWIDYVNGESREVLSLLKPKSQAYRNASGFSKVGKVTETFKALSIGEIRKGESGFYVFTKESIEILANGKTSTKNYDWIYYLEPLDNKMLIVSYF